MRSLTALCLPAALLAACAAPPPGSVTASGEPGPGGIVLHPVPPDEQVPDYAKKPYEPFSRQNAAAIAVREWRAWGMPVNDAQPGPDMPVSIRPDRQPGMWERVGDYWWIGQNAVSSGSAWTGKYGDFGVPISGEPAAWSAAFISYVMRVAGAGDRFPYSPLHATYINAAAAGNPILQAQPPDSYPPSQGDLICYGRRGAQNLRFSDLPATSFYGHCDMVIQSDPGMLSVIGGNVSAGVTMKHVPVTATGTLADTTGTPVDSRYPWFVVLRVAYDDPTYLPNPIGSPVSASIPMSSLPLPDAELVTQDETKPVPPKRRVAPRRHRAFGRWR